MVLSSFKEYEPEVPWMVMLFEFGLVTVVVVVAPNLEVLEVRTVARLRPVELWLWCRVY